jgi:hypothetical protein
MKCTLTVRQRIDLNGVLPREANLTAIRMIRELREDLSFSDDEHKRINLQYHANGAVGWDQRKAKALTKTVEVPETIRKMLETSFKSLDKDCKLTEEHIDLYDMFVHPKKAKKPKC